MLPNKKMLQKNFFWISAFSGRFLTGKQPKNSQIFFCQNPNRLMKFSEICYLDASQQQKMLQKNLFWILAFFGRFLTKKQQKKMPKSKPFDEIFWNLVCRCLLVNENSPQSPIFDFGLFWPFFTKKGRNWQKWRKLAKSKPFDEIFLNLVCRCFPTKKML